MQVGHEVRARFAGIVLLAGLVAGSALFGQVSSTLQQAKLPQATSPQGLDPLHLPTGQSASAESRDPALQQAEGLLRSGDSKTAEQMTRQYLRAHPNSADAHFLLGLILFREQRATDSLAEYTTGAKERQPSAYDLKIVALNYGILKDFLDADKWLTKSLDWNPKDSEGWYYLGRIKYNSNRFDEAIAAFQKCLALDPGNVKAEDNLGLSYEGLGNAEAALEAYRKAIEWQAQVAAKNPGPWINAGSLLVEKDRPEEAIPMLRAAIEIAPDEFKAHQQLGKAYERLEQLPQAQQAMERAVALAPDNAPLHFVLGQIYRRQGFTEKANAEFKRCAALNGSHSTKNVPSR